MKFLVLSFISLFILFYIVTGQPNFIERQQLTTDFFWRTPNNICIADLDSDG